MTKRNRVAKLVVLLVGVSALWQAGVMGAASGSNLTLRNEIDFGSFAGQVLMCGSGVETPVNRVAASAGYKYLLISVKVLKLANKAEVNTASFVLVGAKTTFNKPGAWGKIDLMGSKRDFEASSGATLTIGKAGEVVNIFFQVPENAREQDFNLKYR
jgi:hypothetical protein